jgi:tetratricopeptide (TPR) repeat protein
MLACSAPAACNAVKIFISYARKDKKLCEGFRAALAPLARIHGVETWHDGQILPGGTFEDDIAQALEAADVAALLVSKHFFVSDYSYGIEMKRLLERYAAGECVVVPVIVDFVAGWQAGPFGHLNAVPGDGKCVRAFRPQSKGWKEVAEGFIRLLPKTPTKPAAVLRHLPILRNSFFTGREADLQWIADTLAAGRPAALLHGMGGVGKTQTAAEFACRHADEYKVVWWVTAETATQADGDYGKLAEALKLPGYDPRDAEKTRRAVVEWMEREGGWLVVLDNAESAKDAAPWLPKAAKGHLLITSRNPNWVNRAAVHDVNVWSAQEATDFLMQRSDDDFLMQRSGDKDRAAAEKLAQMLGCLPLACETAAAYAAETGGGLARFADLLARQPVKVLDFLQEDPVYARTLPQVIGLAVEAVEGESSLALAILRGLAWLAPDNIPRWLLDKWPAEPMEIDAALAVLLRRALLRKAGDGFAVHRLTQQIIRATDPNADDSAVKAIRALAGALDGDPQFDVQHWPRYAALLPHGEALFALLLPDPPPELQAANWICSQLGVFLGIAKGDYPAAKRFLEKALALTEDRGGCDHVKLAIDLSNLGSLLQVMGDSAGAKPLFQRALGIDEQALGSDHQHVAIRLSGLGIAHHNLGELNEARRCHERSLKIRKANHGPDHPLVAKALSNLAFVLEKQGDQQAARAHFERALEISRNHPERGADHPETGLRHHNLGRHLFEQGHAAAAEPHLVRALEIREKHLDPKHPSIVITRENLAAVRKALGKS